jgi:hypothetical protein
MIALQEALPTKILRAIIVSTIRLTDEAHRNALTLLI